MRVFLPLLAVAAFLMGVAAFLMGADVLLWAFVPVVSVLAGLGALCAAWASFLASGPSSPCCRSAGVHLGGTLWRCDDCGRNFTADDFGE